MKSMSIFNMRYRYLRSHFSFPYLVSLILILTSCSSRPEPYSILEFTGAADINNFSKSHLLMLNKSDSINPTVIMGSKGDLFWCDENIFLCNDSSSRNRFLIKSTDSVLYVNDKIYSIDIPDNDDMIPWFKNMNARDFSALQFINIDSKLPENYLPYLTELAKIKPDAGLCFPGKIEDITGLLKVFNPRIIIGPALLRNDYDRLSKLTNLEILMITLNDSVITDPLPYMPELEQLFLSELDDNISLTSNFLLNNKQIERLIIQKSGSLDFSILKPLDNLKELVVNVSDSIINFDLINEHKNLEVLSVTGDNLVYNPDLVKLPLLRWMTFSSNVTQAEFNSFVDTHSDLEVIELIKNDKISSLRSLSKLNKLYGLTITDTITDIASIKNLRTLKYLSLPDNFLDDPVNKTEIQKSLPGTRIAANEGFCLGSGWLLLIIPLVLILRFISSKERQRLKNDVKS
jgi:hypothetical protein